MARIDVRHEVWLEFRLQQKRSVADYLGELVRSEIEERSGHERATEDPIGDKEGPPRARPAGSRVRLSDAKPSHVTSSR